MKLTSTANLPRAFTLLALLSVLGGQARAQQPRINSHEVNPDQSVTFRYYAPSAEKVLVALDYDHDHPAGMTKGADGVWSHTTSRLQAAVHAYTLTVDGVDVLDPLNPEMERSPVFVTNQVRVPGAVAQPWDETGVPHGVIHQHRYRTAIARNLTDSIEEYYVYTPPGYDPSAATTYPVLYFLHGWGSLADSSVHAGQANLILDNLVAQHLAVPMIVVMPQTYGDLDFVTKGYPKLGDPAAFASNIALFEATLINEVIPQVEAAYRSRHDRAGRAVAGISMGGGESLLIGLNHGDMFASVGGFSSAVVYDDPKSVLPSLSADPAKRPALLWIACGTGDALLGYNRKFIAYLRTQGLEPDAVETPGIHNWPVWRDDMVRFFPRLFRDTARP